MAPKEDVSNNTTSPPLSPKMKLEKYGNRFDPNSTVETRWSDDNIQGVRELWTLSNKQVMQLLQLKDKLSDVDHFKNDPYEVIRFLTTIAAASKYADKGATGTKDGKKEKKSKLDKKSEEKIINKVEEAFRDMIQWRIDNKIDDILTEYKAPEELQMHYPASMLDNVDKDGDPIYFERLGVLDAGGIIKHYGKDHVMNYAIWLRENTEWVTEYENQYDRKFKYCTIIMDLKGITLSQHANAKILKVFSKIMDLDEKYYCGTEKRIILLRTPKTFESIWKVVKPLVPKVIREKMVVTNSDNYLDKLQEYIDLSVLPPVVYPEGGIGKAAIGMPQQNFEGGKLPSTKEKNEG